MAVDRITLPTDPEVLGDVLTRHAQREDTVILFRRTIWLLAYYYLNGARSFTDCAGLIASISAGNRSTSSSAWWWRAAVSK